MKIHPLVSALVASSLVLVALPSQAVTVPSAHNVTQAQIDGLRAGEPVSEITKTLGTPENTTAWLDGSRSLVYDLVSSGEPAKFAYVDLTRDGKLAEVQIVEP